MDSKQKEKIFIDLFQNNKDKIYRLCKAYLYDKNEAEDLFQEVMMNVWTNLHKFRGDAKIETWVYRITVNTALMFNKGTKKKGKLIIDIKNDKTFGVDESDLGSENNEKIQLMHKCISKLKKQDRLIISLLFEGMSYEEISDVVGVSVNYVGVKINRIKPVLLKLMREGSHE